VHVDHVGLRVEVIFPHRFQQHGAGHHLVGVPHQVFEQLELARLQGHGAAAARHPPGQQVHAQVPDLQRPLGIPAGAALAACACAMRLSRSGDLKPRHQSAAGHSGASGLAFVDHSGGGATSGW